MDDYAAGRKDLLQQSVFQPICRGYDLLWSCSASIKPPLQLPWDLGSQFTCNHFHYWDSRVIFSRLSSWVKSVDLLLLAILSPYKIFIISRPFQQWAASFISTKRRHSNRYNKRSTWKKQQWLTCFCFVIHCFARNPSDGTKPVVWWCLLI